ncbi:MAG: hypothetical protein HQ478_05300, partial [Chloroflexi bacterium]|nr:hypothetical protein [Chloroflexota bacterium]
MAILAIAILALACTDSDAEAEQALFDAQAQVVNGDSPQSEWARDRVAAITKIWNFTDEGISWMEGYDFRQMVGQPTWYGSTGFQGWAGAGQAVPKTIMHELSHSYWGVFGSSVNSGLDWSRPGSGLPSEGHLAYRADLESFMRQPPDRFEPLRDRFRNLTNLSLTPDSDLFHFGEAEMVNMTGGDLDLVPPILRPYYDQFLTDVGVGGIDFDDWPQAIGWFQNLDDDQQREGGELFAIQHFPLRFYEDLNDSNLVGFPDSPSRVLEDEDRQRLRDFAEQFDLIKEREFALVDAAGIDRGFQFWTGYLREMQALHDKHPEVLAEMPNGLGAALAEGFEFYDDIRGESVESQVMRVSVRLGETIIRDMAVLLPPQTLLDLFDGVSGISGDGLDQILTGQVATLRQLAEVADQIIESSPAGGAALLNDFVASRSIDEVRTTVGVLIGLLRDAAPERLVESMPLISDSTLLRLLEARPEIARSPEVTPIRLLSALVASAGASIESLSIAGFTLFSNSSGNFEIDRPVDKAFYDLLAERERNEPGLTMQVIEGASLGLFTWIRSNPDSAGIAISNSPELSASLIQQKTSLRSFPARTIHRLISVDPILTADLLSMIDAKSDSDLRRGTLQRAPT